MTQILKGHTSPETAYIVESYPYGRHRTQKRYWLEYKANRGVRCMGQTLNPKTHKWNKPKASTYARFGGCLYLDENEHVQWAGLTEYSDGKESAEFIQTYGEGVPEEAQPLLRKWAAAKEFYEAYQAFAKA
jgi:hypothetical protein